MPPIVLPVLVATAIVLGLLLLALRMLPARWACPRCHHATSPVEDRWARALAGVFERRWCPRCHWSAITRRRAWLPTREQPRPAEDPDPGPPTGFTWKDPTAEAPTFRWKVVEREKPGDGLGFRWKSRSDGR